jgi:hypothetical protein
LASETYDCTYCGALCGNEKTSSYAYICKSCWDIDIEIIQEDEVMPINALDEE